jgi:hypothetical protein
MNQRDIDKFNHVMDKIYFWMWWGTFALLFYFFASGAALT